MQVRPWQRHASARDGIREQEDFLRVDVAHRSGVSDKCDLLDVNTSY